MSDFHTSQDSLNHTPLKQQGCPIQDVELAERDPPKWLTVSPQCLRGMRNCGAHAGSKASLTHGTLKQQGPSIQPGTLLCQCGLLSLPPARWGRRYFLMSHFYSGDKVSYPRRLKRPRRALEWQLWDARQTQSDAAATRKGGAVGPGLNVNKSKGVKQEEKIYVQKKRFKNNISKGGNVSSFLFPEKLGVIFRGFFFLLVYFFQHLICVNVSWE